MFQQCISQSLVQHKLIATDDSKICLDISARYYMVPDIKRSIRRSPGTFLIKTETVEIWHIIQKSARVLFIYFVVIVMDFI